MQQAARELLRAIRGRWSQQQLARRLGYRSNPVADWEAGRRVPSALELFRACRCVGIDVDGALRSFHRDGPPFASGEVEELAVWLDSLRGSRTVVELSRDAGVSRFKLGRWFTGRSVPRVHQFLSLIEAMTGRVSELVAALVPIETVPTLLSAHRAAQAAKRLAHEVPWTEAVLRVLEAKPYAPGVMASQLGIDQATERLCIQKLCEARVVERDAAGGLRVARAMNVDTKAASALKTHWCEVAKQRLDAPRPADLFAYNVISASQDDVTRIRQLLLDTYQEIRTIVKSSPSADSVALVNMQLVSFDDPDAG